MIGQLRYLEISAALMLSLTVHFAFAIMAGRSEPSVLIEGGAPATVTALGNSFADFAAGMQAPEPVTEAAPEPEAPVPATPVPVTPVPVTPAPVAPEAPPPLAVSPAQPAESAPLEPSEAQRSPEAPPEQAEAVNAVSRLLPGAGVSVAAPAASILAPVAPSQIITALPDGPTPEERRAAERRAQAEREQRERQARERRQAEQRERARQEQRRAQRGNANRNARAGQSDGQTGARATASGNRGSRSVRAGNAAASNYAGQVYSTIRRTRQRGASGRGTARIRFSVTASGRIGSIRIARSSGNRSVDRAALDHIRRSAPFPRPPPGAQRNFVIPVRIR